MRTLIVTISSDNPEHFDTSVNEKLAQGWKPIYETHRVTRLKDLVGHDFSNVIIFSMILAKSSYDQQQRTGV